MAAQASELAAFLERQPQLRESGAQESRYWSGVLAGHEIALAVTGEGRRAAALGCERLLNAFEPSELIGIGVAGALSPQLEPGALVIAADVRLEDGGRLVLDFRSGAESGGARPVSVMTTDRIVCSAAERHALWQRTDFEPAAVVDMESYDFVSAARSRRVDVAILRVVSDGVDDRLPPWLNRCRRPDGTISRARAAARAVGAPIWVPALLRMRRRLADASVVLADVLESLLV